MMNSNQKQKLKGSSKPKAKPSKPKSCKKTKDCKKGQKCIKNLCGSSGRGIMIKTIGTNKVSTSSGRRKRRRKNRRRRFGG